MNRLFSFLLIVSFVFVAGCSRYSSIKKGCIKVSDSSQLQEKRSKNYKIGKPYKISGRWYKPCEDFTYDEVGYASWYGYDCHGKPTANGERFHQHGLTCAHKTLSLPCYVQVTNLENGKEVVLRVNDRGPFGPHAKRRILDVTQRAASVLGFRHKGETKVRVRVLKDPSLKAAGLKSGSSKVIDAHYDDHHKTHAHEPFSSRNGSSGQHYLHLGMTSSLRDAKNHVSTLKKSVPVHLKTLKVSGKTKYLICVGPYKTRDRAKYAEKALHKKGYKKIQVVKG